MIINGGSRSNWRFFAKHLVKTEENEQVRVTEIRGLAAETVLEALREMDALASGTRCKNFFYHANLNPRADETLDDQQWDQAVDRLEAQLGLDGHSRFIVEHQKDGRQHRHVVWSRIDTDSMTAVSDSNNFAAHEHTARELEQLFGQSAVIGAHGRDGKRPERRPKNWETFRGHESGLDPAAVTRAVTALWRQADSGRAFAAALKEHGYQLCRGDRRDYCLMDAAGDVHSLARRIAGVKAAAIRERLADLDPMTLPTVAEARQQRPVEPAAATPTPLTPPAAPEPGQGRAVAEAPDSAPPMATPSAAQPASALDAFAHQVTQTLRSNDGEPHYADGMSWLDRSITVLGAIRDAAANWVKGRWQEFADQFRSDRGPPTDDHERER